MVDTKLALNTIASTVPAIHLQRLHHESNRRLIVNLSQLDGYFKPQSVKMETLESFVLDLK